ncbi:MAG: hypothetical protein ACJAZW_001918 [Maritalea sp.]|jgi:hypothetical protein
MDVFFIVWPCACPWQLAVFTEQTASLLAKTEGVGETCQMTFKFIYKHWFDAQINANRSQLFQQSSLSSPIDLMKSDA